MGIPLTPDLPGTIFPDFRQTGNSEQSNEHMALKLYKKYSGRRREGYL
jgi:hypothetical protein